MASVNCWTFLASSSIVQMGSLSTFSEIMRIIDHLVEKNMHLNNSESKVNKSEDVKTRWTYLKTLYQADYQSAHFHPELLLVHPIYVQGFQLVDKMEGCNSCMFLEDYCTGQPCLPRA
jgi:hypothetical protein